MPTEALRSLVDAILALSGERGGEVTVQRRGDLAAFDGLLDAFGQASSVAARVSSGAIGSVVGSSVVVRGLGRADTRFQESR